MDVKFGLSPFEVRYDEKRQFFTEGTELFDKCGIFYTRRVGSFPKNFGAAYDSLGPNEEVVKNPEKTRIINATIHQLQCDGGGPEPEEQFVCNADQHQLLDSR